MSQPKNGLDVKGLHSLPGAPVLASIKNVEKRDIVFRIMIVGEQGLGKSTLIACLLMTGSPQYKAQLQVERSEGVWETVSKLPGGSSTQAFRKYRYILQERGSNLKAVFEIIDTPGFASMINNENSWLSKLEVVERGLKAYNEGRRTETEDPRVHLCLFLISPLPRPLKQLDKRVLLELQRVVPVVPIIAKADCFDGKSISSFQQKLRDEFAQVGIAPFTPKKSKQGAGAPFSVIASNEHWKQDGTGKWVRTSDGENFKVGRLYPWGFACCDEHSELPAIRDILIHHRMAIMEECDILANEAHKFRKQIITVTAEALCQKRYDDDVKKYNDALKRKFGCCLPCRAMGSSTAKKPVKNDPTDHDKAEATMYWEDTFKKQYSSLQAMEQEAAMHAIVEQRSDYHMVERLENLYTQRIETQLMYLPVELREYIKEQVTAGALKIEIHGLVSGLLTAGPRRSIFHSFARFIRGICAPKA